MKPLNNSLLPKYNKYTHKEILDLTGSTIQLRKVPVSCFWLCIAILFACLSITLPDLGLGLLIGLFLLGRYG